MSDVTKYPCALKALHWIMALAMITLVIVGFIMGDLEKPLKFQVYGLHKAVGVTIFGLILVRILVRLKGPIPPLDGKVKWENMLAHAVHFGLYAVMILMPVSGFVMSDAGGHPVSWFGLQIPDLIEDNKALGGFAHDAHEILAWVTVGLFSLHVAGVIKHIVIDKQPIISRMWK